MTCEMNSNRSEMLVVGKSEMAALMRSRFACAENNANWSQALSGLVETWSQSLQSVKPTRLTLPVRFDRRFSGAT